MTLPQVTALKRAGWPATVIILLSLLVCSGEFMARGVIVINHPLDWGFVNWAHRFPLLLDLFRDAFQHGIWYPRWLPSLMGGNGYPTFDFYEPGAFFFALPFALLIHNTVLATKMALLVMILLGGTGAYLLARLFASRTVATASAALYLLLPYLLADLYIRAAYAELFAMQLCPWCGYFTFRMQRAWLMRTPMRRWATGFIASLGLLFFSHPFVTLHFAVALGLLVIALAAESKDLRLLLLYVLCGTCSLILASPYLLTAFQLRDDIHYEGILFTYDDWLQPIHRLLLANPLSTLMMLAGFYLQRTSRITWALAAAWLWLMFVNTIYAQGLWQAFFPLRLTQLSYRAFTVEAFIRLLGITFALSALEARVTQKAQAMIAVVCMSTAAMIVNPMALPLHSEPFSLFGLAVRTADEDQDSYAQSANTRYNDESYAYDFLPRWVKLEQLKKEAPFSLPLYWVSPAHAADILLPPNNSSYHMEVNLNVSSAPATLHIRQFFMRGWQVEVDGKTQAAAETPRADNDMPWAWGPAEDGRIQLVFSKPGMYHITASYTGPPGWLWRNLFMFLSLAVLDHAIALLLRKRQYD